MHAIPLTQPKGKPQTYFAPAERSSRKRTMELSHNALLSPIVRVVLESLDGFVLILNEKRQILAANPEVLAALGVTDSDSLVGLRPGEAFNCIHSNEGPNGCGTSKTCSGCGAVISIMASLAWDSISVNECLMTMERNGTLEALEFRVRCTPLELSAERILIFVLHDISASKRRESLEKIFFHDAMNLLTCIQGWSDQLLSNPDSGEQAARNIVRLSQRLAEEIQNQRTLLLAEKGELIPDLSSVRVADIFLDLRAFFTNFPDGKGCQLETLTPPDNPVLITSRPLLNRILINMVKNAQEATGSDGTVRVWFEHSTDGAGFVVHNPEVIPDDVQLHIFQRSFSTKSISGRGLGTYSMKLFGERYLGGKVSFTSSNKSGTCFRITLPPKSCHFA